MLGNTFGQFNYGQSLAQQSASLLFRQQLESASLLFRQQLESKNMGSTPGISHLGTVKEFRKEFNKYSKEEFRNVSKEPMIKDILTGMTKLNQKEIIARIKEHLEE